MRRIITAVSLVAIVGALGACAESADNTASPGTSSATAASLPPSVGVPAGNTKDVCAAVEALTGDETRDAFGRTLGSLVTAETLKNAEMAATATKLIQTTAAVTANQLDVLQQQATDPELRTALGTLASAYTAVGKGEYLAGVKTYEDAGQAINLLSPGLDAVDKICV
jgi:hypothetical protein